MLVKCTALAALDLRKNDVGHEGARRLAGVLAQCPTVVHLDFRWDRNGVDAMVRIGKCLLNRDRGEVSFLFRRGYTLKFKDKNGFWCAGPVTRDLF